MNIGGDNSGPFVRKYLGPARLDEGNAWCASFVSWCFLQAVEGDASALPFASSAVPRLRGTRRAASCR